MGIGYGISGLQTRILVPPKARDQKQLYRLYETKSHSGGGGLKYVRLSHLPFSWPFWPPN